MVSRIAAALAGTADESAGRRSCARGASVLLVYLSYWFVMEPPQAHAFYVLAPVAFVFAAYWWTFVDSPRARRVAAGCWPSIAFHAGLAWTQLPEISIYRNREVVAAAVRLKQPEMFAHRRGSRSAAGRRRSRSGAARTIRPRSRSRRPRDGRGPAASMHWTVTLRNRSASSPIATCCT